MNIKRVSLLIFIVVLVMAGSWQVGEGLYIHAKALLAQELLEHAWQKTRNGETRATPWPWADTWPVARLSVPSQHLSLIVLAGDSGRTLAFGPGHNFGSAALGEKGNSLVSGHRDTHFRFLEYLQQGDRIFIDTPQGQRKMYRVEATSIVYAHNAKLLSDRKTSRLNLVTCYPFDAIVPGGSQRFIVTAVEDNSPSNPLQPEVFMDKQNHNTM